VKRPLVLLLSCLLLAVPGVAAASGPEADHDCVRRTVMAPQLSVYDDLIHSETSWYCHNGTGTAGRIIGMAASAQLQVYRAGAWRTVASDVSTRSNAGTVYMIMHASCANLIRGGTLSWRTVHAHASAVRLDHQAVIRGRTAGATRGLPCG
jgi:hypothetical protein